MKREFHPAARDEFLATTEYYDAALTGLGRRFRDAVQGTIDRVETHPQSGREGTSHSRRVVIAGFPYDLVYRVRADVLEILALSHHRRRPGYWKDRLSR